MLEEAGLFALDGPIVDLIPRTGPTFKTPAVHPFLTGAASWARGMLALSAAGPPV